MKRKEKVKRRQCLQGKVVENWRLNFCLGLLKFPELPLNDAGKNCIFSNIILNYVYEENAVIEKAPSHCQSKTSTPP